MRDITVSGIGQADDTVLLSNSLFSLQNLLYLSLNFCKKQQVILCVEKTKLQVLSTPNMKNDVNYMKLISPVKINGQKIDFFEEVEHVGVVRSTNGNLPNLITRITSHKKALAAVLFTGMARAHRGNPSTSLFIEKMYATSVLLSGLGALVLKKVEIDFIDQHLNKTLENLMRLHSLTPRCVTAFLAGSLPGSALLHLRQFSLFGMITRLPENILFKHALNVLTCSKSSSNSWFVQVRNLFLQYNLPHPLNFLENPLSKTAFKSTVKKHVISYWECQLRAEASARSSLIFFHPEYLSLVRPHPIWLTAGSSPYQVNMATIQAKMLSGRYRTETTTSYWSKNPNGYCLLPSCIGRNTQEDLIHMLTCCGSLDQARSSLMAFTTTRTQATSSPILKTIVDQYCLPSHPQFSQFLIDCSCLSPVIAATQLYGQDVLQHLFKITRTWCYVLHRERLKILGRWSLHRH